MKKNIKKMSLILLSAVMAAAMFAFWGCSPQAYFREVKFSYSEANYTPIIGSKTNSETFAPIVVNPVSGLRDDYIMGVDASMISDVEEQGGVYYNSEGKEQDVFQIMAGSGVNFFRVRVWNDPFDKYGDGYGGGSVDTVKAVAMAKRAQRAGMNVLVDLHYSDFWADPDTQDLPKSWSSKTKDELITEVGNFTKKTLNSFKNNGVNVSMVQIGNEINNGMLWPVGKIDWNNEEESFKFLAKLISSGIKGAKEVFPDIYTAIHLANGGNADEFDVFFGYMNKFSVEYDAIGVSYYPYYHGTIEALKNNMDSVTEKYNKYVYVAELSYGFTDASNAYTENTYNSSMEDAGKYLTSIQGQATAVRDVIQAVAQVPKKRGLGVFYWEPAWLPVPNVGWANAASGKVTSNGKATWANQGLFSYLGKALPSLSVFNRVKADGKVVDETPLKLRFSTVDISINLAENETLPATVSVETDQGAIRQFEVEWVNGDIKKQGDYTITGTVKQLLSNNTVTANVSAIVNYIKDAGYEKQGKTDALLAPWVIKSVAPESEKIVKLDRKSDTRSGKTDLNWYHGTKAFSFKIEQQIDGLENGTYSLSAYCMATEKHTELTVYIEYGGERLTFDLKDKVKGWGAKDTYYIKALIENIKITSPTVTIGIMGAAPADSWGHLDDWALVKIA